MPWRSGRWRSRRLWRPWEHHWSRGKESTLVRARLDCAERGNPVWVRALVTAAGKPEVTMA